MQIERMIYAIFCHSKENFEGTDTLCVPPRNSGGVIPKNQKKVCDLISSTNLSHLCKPNGLKCQINYAKMHFF